MIEAVWRRANGDEPWFRALLALELACAEPSALAALQETPQEAPVQALLAQEQRQRPDGAPVPHRSQLARRLLALDLLDLAVAREILEEARWGHLPGDLCALVLLALREGEPRPALDADDLSLLDALLLRLGDGRGVEIALEQLREGSDPSSCGWLASWLLSPLTLARARSAVSRYVDGELTRIGLHAEVQPMIEAARLLPGRWPLNTAAVRDLLLALAPAGDPIDLEPLRAILAADAESWEFRALTWSRLGSRDRLDVLFAPTLRARWERLRPETRVQMRGRAYREPPPPRGEPVFRPARRSEGERREILRSMLSQAREVAVVELFGLDGPTTQALRRSLGRARMVTGRVELLREALADHGHEALVPEVEGPVALVLADRGGLVPALLGLVRWALDWDPLRYRRLSSPRNSRRGGPRHHDRPRPGPSVQIKAIVAEELLRGPALRDWLREHEEIRRRLLWLLAAWAGVGPSLPAR